MTIIVDGNANYPSCRCTPDCEMPCWQLFGLTDQPCGACGCDAFEYKPVVVSVRPGEPIPDGYAPLNPEDKTT